MAACRVVKLYPLFAGPIPHVDLFFCFGPAECGPARHAGDDVAAWSSNGHGNGAGEEIGGLAAIDYPLYRCLV